ncbi:MAG TPA: hypothetical protein VKZ53_07135 [Candidatus Angelobacter sp.]|nr:hypothetical protein [Candidatus Angelobacter sp.]
MKNLNIRGLVLIEPGGQSTGDPLASADPLPLMEIAGKTPLERIKERLQQAGIEEILIVLDPDHASLAERAGIKKEFIYTGSGSERFWRAAETAFGDLAQNGADLVILIQLGAYAEVDFDQLAQFHLEQQARVTRVHCQSKPLQVFCVSASRRNYAASLFRSRLSQCRTECPVFESSGYFNVLRDLRDLRQLAVDIFTLKTETRPAGEELKPGVWTCAGSVIEKGARVLAPAFIGPYARVHAGAVVTRCSTVERCSRVDCGTVVENSTVLPYSYIGAGLDLAHSIAGSNKIANLRRNVCTEIADKKLMAMISTATVTQFLKAAGAFVALLPKQILRGAADRRQPQTADSRARLQEPVSRIGTAASYTADTTGSAPLELTSVRKYGRQ